MAKKLTLAQNAAYNTVGTIIYCFCQWATTMVVVRLFNGYDSAGIFQLAISITNIFYAISTYNIRTYQVSDIENEYSSGDYIGLRIVTCFIALALCVGYSVIIGYPAKTVLCIIFYMIFKFNESFTDVLHGIDQKNYRMDYVGISYTIRGIVMILSFTLSVLVTHDILISIVLQALLVNAVVVLYDIRKTKTLSSVKPNFHFGKIKNMLIKCLPMVIASSSFAAVVTVPRQFLENKFSESVLGYYATVATPIVVIQVLATSVFNPMITDIAVYYGKGDFGKIKSIILKTLLIIIGFTFVALFGAYLLGEFALTLLYGDSIREYVYLMYAIIICTVFYALCWLLTSILTVMRKLLTLTAVSVLSLAVSIGASSFFIDKFYMNGVSYTVILAYAVFSVACAVVIAKNLKTRGKTP